MGGAPALLQAASLHLCSSPSALPVAVRPRAMLAVGCRVFCRAPACTAVLLRDLPCSCVFCR
eukprot:9042845-Pyramimonas_sp.AAC.1